jgi:hypothetical protein
VILHLETAVAYSRNSLLSSRGRPSSSLLDRALSERAGAPNVMYKSIAVFLRLQLLASLPTPALLAILRITSVCQTGAALAHPSRNFSPLLVQAPTASNLLS